MMPSSPWPLSWLKGRWSGYKYRFVPWLAVNLRRQLKREGGKAKVRVKAGSGSDASVTLLRSLLTRFRAPSTSEVPHLYRDTPRLRSLFSKLHLANSEVLRSEWGFRLCVRRSRIEGAGSGVFVAEGSVGRGQLVCLYPGTLYRPGQPVLLQSINNSYILRCCDGIHVDGSHRFPSRSIYKSCHGRDRLGMLPLCDISWLAIGHAHPNQGHAYSSLMNPLSVGQIVNNEDGKEFRANVEYSECDVFPDFPAELRMFLPNCHYESDAWDGGALRIVPLVATRDIEEGEELYSSYFSLVDS